MARVLIVDDDPGIRAHLTAYLREVGHEAGSDDDEVDGLGVSKRLRHLIFSRSMTKPG